MVFDNESLAYWERTRRQHLKNVKENPKVVVLFRDTKTKRQLALPWNGDLARARLAQGSSHGKDREGRTR